MSSKRTAEKQPGLTFEESYSRLTEAVGKLEAGEGTLTERTALFEEGVRLARECSAHLDEIEKKVEILLRAGSKDEERVPFEEGEED